MNALVLAAVLQAALPEGAVRYRFELFGEHVGVVDLGVACAAEACTATWVSERRAPADAGGRRTARRLEIAVDREGRYQGGRLHAADDGGGLKAAGAPGAVPAALAEVVLQALVPIPPRKGWQSSLPPGPEICLEAFDEWTGEAGQACAHREGDALVATVLGARATIAPGPDGFPRLVELPEQGARFVRDPEATAPRQPPRLVGTTVPGPSDPLRAASFCGAPRDPEASADGLSAVPEPRAPGASCREKAAAWIERAARAGLRGRTAIGVAWDGSRFVWHAWAEVRLARGWVPVDPSFGERPARGPRFTLATIDPGDEPARQRAGERILACWPDERVRGP